jgi:hypothetical protein
VFDSCLAALAARAELQSALTRGSRGESLGVLGICAEARGPELDPGLDVGGLRNPRGSDMSDEILGERGGVGVLRP